jgi:hypothetical protein
MVDRGRDRRHPALAILKARARSGPARSFLATLTSEQRRAACFAIGDEAWRKWSNIHPWLMRHGVCLADLGSGRRRTIRLSSGTCREMGELAVAVTAI